MTRALAEKVAREIGKEWMFSEKDIKRMADIIERASGEEAWKKTTTFVSEKHWGPDDDYLTIETQVMAEHGFKRGQEVEIWIRPVPSPPTAEEKK